MLLSRHILFRNGYYYYRHVIPNDLKNLIPFREIKQSLKTNNRTIAECQALIIEGNVQKTFSLIRSGVVSQETILQLFEPIIPRQKNKSSSQIKFSKLINLYIRNEAKGWTQKTLMEVNGVSRLLLAIVGDKYVASFTRQMMLDLREKLERLPSNLYKKYPHKTISEILTFHELTTMTLVSVNKHMCRMSSILRFAVREGVITRNVAEGLKIPSKRRNDEERSAYSDEEVRKVVNLLSYSMANVRDERKWIPLIGIYSGMRLDEICQLYIEDIQQINNIWCFNVNDEKDKKLKNIASRRIIPIHPFLITRGLLAYVERLKSQKQERLWPNLTFCKINGYSNSFGKWYQRFNRKHITQNKRKVFHSFRHAFANKLKQDSASESVITELLGHKNHSITTGRYGKRYEVQILYNNILMVNY